MNQKRILFTLLCVVLDSLVAGPALADEELLIQPPPATAQELPSVFDLGLRERIAPTVTFENVLEKSSLDLHLRNFYFNRAKPDALDSIAWAQGGALKYRTGKVGGVFSLSAEYFGSFELYAPEEHDGTLLLEPGQKDIDVLGVANGRFDLEGNIISLYRQRYQLPYVNDQDNRMVPNTFEGYTLAMPKTSNERFQYVLGYIDKMKTREEDTFVSMSDAAGVESQEKGIYTAGVRVYPIPALSIGAVDYLLDDILNIFYTELVYKSVPFEGFDSNLSLQYSAQDTTGTSTLRGDSYSSSFWGVQEALSYRHAILRLAFNQTDTGALMRAPFGSHPGYTSSTVEDFNRAGESSWLAGLSYDFGRLGLKDLTLRTTYISGSNAIDEITKNHLADRNETDVDIDYKVSEGRMKGFWLRLRMAAVDEDQKDTLEDYRVIVNYELPLKTAESWPSTS